MRNTTTSIIAAIAVAIASLAGTAQATNGYFQHGFGPESKALAGAGSAVPHTSLSTVVNPAAAASIGNRHDFGLNVFMPKVSYTVEGDPSGFPGTFGLAPGTVDSDADLFVIPHFGYNRALGANQAVGLVLSANGGMATDYPTATFHGTSASSGVSLEQGFAALTYARTVVPDHAVGVSAVLGIQRFSADGLDAFSAFSADPTKLTNNGKSVAFGYGVRLGYLGQVHDLVSLGATYHTKVFMSAYDDYAGLFAEQGGFDVPATWQAGIAVGPVSGIRVLFDVQQIFYTGVNSVANAFDPAAFQQGIQLGDDNGPGFGWEDVTVYKIGLLWDQNDRLALRAGYSIANQPIPGEAALINILAPGVIEQHVAIGGTWQLTPTKSVSVSIGHALESTVTGSNVMEAPGQQTIDLDMSQWDVEIGFSLE